MKDEREEAIERENGADGVDQQPRAAGAGDGAEGAIVIALFLRSRYRLSILESSSLGVITWLQRRL